ncbi:MAG: hypothetical protein AAF226_12090, partial [Verrucomicrobiota bacterium]
ALIEESALTEARLTKVASRELTNTELDETIQEYAQRSLTADWLIEMKRIEGSRMGWHDEKALQQHRNRSLKRYWALHRGAREAGMDLKFDWKFVRRWMDGSTRYYLRPRGIKLLERAQEVDRALVYRFGRKEWGGAEFSIFQHSSYQDFAKGLPAPMDVLEVQQRRDFTLIASQLELFYREQGRYPSTQEYERNPRFTKVISRWHRTDSVVYQPVGSTYRLSAPVADDCPFQRKLPVLVWVPSLSNQTGA